MEVEPKDLLRIAPRLPPPFPKEPRRFPGLQVVIAWIRVPNARLQLRRASVSSRAVGSVALLGSPSTTRLGATFRAL